MIAADTILVAPDLGAVRLDRAYADLLDLPVAYIHKVRLSGEEVNVRGMIGDVHDRTPIVVDDMFSTGGTVVSALNALLDGGARRPVTVATTHGLWVNGAAHKLSQKPVAKIIVSDSVPAPG